MPQRIFGQSVIATFPNMKYFMGDMQIQALEQVEDPYWMEIMERLNERVAIMPKTYEQNGLGDNAIAYLHYFTSSFDWYITEKDLTDEDTEIGEQQQAFGLACLFESEMGFIPITEIIKLGAELDFYFTPRTLGEIKRQRNL